MPTPDPALVQSLIAAQNAATAKIRQQVTGYVRQQWQQQPNYRNPDRFVAAILPIVAAGQTQTAAVMTAYLARMRALFTGSPVNITGVPPEQVTAVREHVTPQEVYERPFHLVWRELADAQAQRDAHFNWTEPTQDAPTRPPMPPENYVQQAIEHGRQRAEALAATDMQLAKRQAAKTAFAHDDKLVGYRRVLEGAYSCGLCIVASTLRYRIDTVRERGGTLFPIHNACDCSLEPIYNANEIQRRPTSFSVDSQVRTADGRLVPVSDIDGVHGRFEDTFGSSSAAARAVGVRGSKGKKILYRDVIVTHDNGELGPVLAVRGQHFVGPADIAKHISPNP